MRQDQLQSGKTNPHLRYEGARQERSDAERRSVEPCPRHSLHDCSSGGSGHRGAGKHSARHNLREAAAAVKRGCSLNAFNYRYARPGLLSHSTNGRLRQSCARAHCGHRLRASARDGGALRSRAHANRPILARSWGPRSTCRTRCWLLAKSMTCRCRGRRVCRANTLAVIRVATVAGKGLRRF